MATQTKPSTSWALSASANLGGGKGRAGAGVIALTLFDVQAQIFFSLGLAGASFGPGIPGVTVSTFSPAFFSTSTPLWVRDFNGRATIAGAELTVVAGSAACYITFWNVDHDPYWIDIGGVQAGLSGGAAVGIYIGRVSTSGDPNHGCIISPGGDPLCGGVSSSPPKPNVSTDPGMSTQP